MQLNFIQINVIAMFLIYQTDLKPQQDFDRINESIRYSYQKLCIYVIKKIKCKHTWNIIIIT